MDERLTVVTASGRSLRFTCGRADASVEMIISTRLP
jgi:hypothetical protein